MTHSQQFRELVVGPVLRQMDMWSQSAENLLMGTFAQESLCGTYIKQMGNGPALGVFQMEPATHDDIVDNYLKYREPIISKVLQCASVAALDKDCLIYNMRYAAAMARIQYYRVAEKLPNADDVDGLARYWKRYYNTELGKGTIPEFVLNYEKVK